MLTLAPIADASVSRKGADENFGNSKQLYVANDGGGELQSLLLLDLALVAESFGPVVGVAAMSVYSASDSDSGAATFRKMARGDWTERGIALDDVDGDDGMGYDEMGYDESMISFVDDLERGAWTSGPPYRPPASLSGPPPLSPSVHSGRPPSQPRRPPSRTSAH